MVVKRNSLVFWSMWRGSLLFSFLNPLLFLTAIGFGVGSLVAQGDPDVFGGVSYLRFFSTGMLAATCMQSGAFAGTFPIMSKITWQKNYEAMLSTPLRVRDIFLGELASTGVTLTLLAVPFFAVMAGFGVPSTSWALLSIPVAVLVGLGASAAVMAYTATLQNDGPFVWLFRFGIIPLFLFSGTFFPVENLPSWVLVIANATPLYHGIELVRGLNFGGLGIVESFWHISYLLAFIAIAIFVGIRNFTRRLLP
jgi:lipooligosaccharide transport system permease protein